MSTPCNSWRANSCRPRLHPSDFGSQQLLEHLLRVGAEDPGDLDELDHVHTALSRLHSADEGVRAAETRGELPLREPCPLASGHENPDQCPVTPAAKRLSQ